MYIYMYCIYNYTYTVHVQCDFQPIWDDDLEIIPTLGPSQAIACGSHEARPQVVLVKI